MSKSPKAIVIAATLVLIATPVLAEKLGLGREAHPDEVKAWDIDVRPDGVGLPPGKGSVKQGEALFLQRCAACHGEFGEGVGRWPPIAGGHGSLDKDNPVKTVGSFWPFASTAFDYLRRSMPFGNAQSLTPDEVYALLAFMLNMNDVVKNDFVLSNENFRSVKLPNEIGFREDDRETTEKHFWRKSLWQFWRKDVCMKDCKTDVKIIGRARILDVTPEDAKKGPKVD